MFIIFRYELRYGRITGSKLYEAAQCKTKDGSLVKQILGATKLYENQHMKRGKKLEKLVLKQLAAKGYKIKKCGFKIVPSHPIFGASPDGIGENYILEIKCPISNQTFKNYLCNGQVMDKFKSQMMLQMKATNNRRGLFCIADPKFEENKLLHTVWVDYDECFLQQIMDKATHFWKMYIFPVLMRLPN